MASAHDVATATAAAQARTGALSDLFRAATEGNLLLDANGRIVFAGGVAHTFFGLTRDTILHQQFVHLLHDNQQQALVSAALDRVRSGVQEPIFEVTVPGPSAQPIVVALHLSALVENQELLGVTVKAFELSTRQAADAAARGDLAASRVLGERSPMIVFHLDARGQCTYFNGEWSTLTGQGAADALGTGWLSTLTGGDKVAFRSMAGAAHKERRGWRHQFMVRNAEGLLRSVDGAAMPLVNTSGATAGYFGVLAVVSTALDDSGSDTSQAAMPMSRLDTTGPTASTGPTGPMAETYATTQAEPIVEAHHVPGFDQIAVPTEMLHAPMADVPHVERHLLPTQDTMGGTWVPPVLQEGFLDPELLLGKKRSDDVAAADGPVTEPAIDRATGLANRLLFAQHVMATVTKIKTEALTVALSFVDMHGIDELRATNGSRVANDYLFLLAKRLEATIRSIEIAGRIEGNVLGILSINWLFADDLPVMCQRLLGRLALPLAGKDNNEIVVPMRMGLAVARPDEDVNTLFRRAWESLELAKASPEHFNIDLG